MNTRSETSDVLVIGAGMAGLIVACELAQAGKKVLVVENLSFIGGRFSAFQVHGSEIPTGAFHTVPYGDRGPFVQAVRRSGAAIQVASIDTFASFHARGQQIVAKTGFGVFKAVPRTGDKIMLLRVLVQTWTRRDYPGSFGEWLAHLGASQDVRLIFDRFAQFALSTSIDDVPYAEGRAVIEMICHYGLPGVPVGGARQVARALGAAATGSGVVIRKSTAVNELLSEHGRICGAIVHDRRHNEYYRINTHTVISTMGPGQTTQMAVKAGICAPAEAPVIAGPSVGLKIQVLSPRALLDHDCIMFCLDTQRVAGILQIANADLGLAPSGAHLLISHQVIPHGANWQAERDLALEDWRYLFGDVFNDCRVVGVSHFPESFPVNWASQGMDIRTQPFSDVGLWLAGDGTKPPGLVMVEGAAASAERVAAQILGKKDISPWRISARDQLDNWMGRTWKWTVGRLAASLPEEDKAGRVLR